MAEIIKLNSISPKANDVLKGYKLVDESSKPIAALVRSFVMNDWEVPSSLIAVSRAGAGVNNIPCRTRVSRQAAARRDPGRPRIC